MEGSKKVYVRSVGKFQTVEQVKQIPIKGTNIRLGDVADIIYDVPERRWVQRIDQFPAIRLGIFKESMANTVSLSKAVRKYIDSINSNPALAGVKIHIFFDQGEFIEEAVDNLEVTGLWAALFAMGVLFFFLRRLRMTIIMTLAIPLSLVLAVIVLYFSGYTLNLLTLTGMMVSVGLVVDNSVVIMESIYRLRVEGEKRMRAAFLGAQEVGLAITMATLTSIVVFLPMIFMGGDNDFSFFFKRFGLPVVCALLGSLFVALVIIPLASSRISASEQVKEPRIIIKSSQLYGRMLKWVLNHRLDTAIIMVIVLVSIYFPFKRVQMTGEEGGHIGDVNVNFRFPPNYTLEDADSAMTFAENFVIERTDRYKVRGIDASFQLGYGQLEIFLEKPEKQSWWKYFGLQIFNELGMFQDSTLSHEEVIEDIRENLPVFPGVKKRMSWREESSGQKRVEVLLYGDDSKVLKELSREVERRLEYIPELVSVETDEERGFDEIQVNLDRTRANNFGANPQVISSTIAYALRGVPLPDFHSEDKEIDVKLQFRKKDREYLYQLENLAITDTSGNAIPLSSVASFTIDKGFNQINRTEGKTYTRIFAFTTSNEMQKLSQDIDRIMKGISMPYGYTWTRGERFESMERENRAQYFALFLAVTFVFLIIGILFESFILPLSVVICIPFGFVGVYWMLYLTNTGFGPMAALGLIILVGVVVNNAIVLIDRVNRLRRGGASRFDALMEAGKNRFRPILMTAFTTILGLFPMAVGNTNMIGMPYAPMGRAIIGGMLSATMLTLLVVPLAYTFFDDFSVFGRRLFGGKVTSDTD